MHCNKTTQNIKRTLITIQSNVSLQRRYPESKRYANHVRRLQDLQCKIVARRIDAEYDCNAAMAEHYCNLDNTIRRLIGYYGHMRQCAEAFEILYIMEGGN